MTCINFMKNFVIDLNSLHSQPPIHSFRALLIQMITMEVPETLATSAYNYTVVIIYRMDAKYNRGKVLELLCHCSATQDSVASSVVVHAIANMVIRPPNLQK